MIACKLFKRRRDGSLSLLFINARQRVPMGKRPEAMDVRHYDRPESQGGTWVLAQVMGVLEVIV